MKKITLLLLLLATSLSFAQLKRIDIDESGVEHIGKAQQIGGHIEAEIIKNNKKYTVSYKDTKFKEIIVYRKFSFEDVENTFEDLYAVILEGFETMPEKSVMLELPDHYIWLKFERLFGTAMMTITSSSDKSNTSELFSSNQISKKQVEKLFGKRK